MNRNLKDDLEVVEKARQFTKIMGWGSKEFHELSPYFSKFHEEGLDIAEHAIKRALEIENILSELFKWGDNPSLDDDYIDGWNDALDEALTQFFQSQGGTG